jgi:hypothetical protein
MYIHTSVQSVTLNRVPINNTSIYSYIHDTYKRLIHTYIFVSIHTHSLTHTLTHTHIHTHTHTHTHTHMEHDSLDENRGGGGGAGAEKGGGGGGFNARDGRAGEEGGEGVRVAVLGTSRRARGRTPLEGDVRYAYVSKET